MKVKRFHVLKNLKFWLLLKNIRESGNAWFTNNSWQELGAAASFGQNIHFSTVPTIPYSVPQLDSLVDISDHPL